MAFDLERIGRGLPVAETIHQLPGLIEQTGSLVVEAPPGTGKTTLVPPALHNHTGGKVLVTAPRRVAVRAAYRRLRSLTSSEGNDGAVGYTIRGEHVDGSAVEFVTPGVLLRRLLADPELTGISAVAVDEVHERQIDTDLVLGMLVELQQLRDDLRVVAMSATLDAQRYAELVSGPVLSTEAVTFPLAAEYAPHEGRLRGTREFYQHLGDQARRAVEKRNESALVFVPGVREVELVAQHVGGVPLHGRLDSKEQDAALAPSARPRIVVATSIAESSLTVPGVRIVVDSGLSRVPRRDAARGMTGLVTTSAAKSTADQRAGRAGREGPGVVVRGYSEAEYQHLAPHIVPEIQTSDLTDAALVMACWGTPRGEGLPLLDAPPPQAIADAQATLREIGAVDDEGRATDLGTKLVRIPVDPRLGAALVRFGQQAAATVAVLSDSPRGDITRARGDRRQVNRLKKMVKDKGPVDPGLVVAAAFPQQVAREVGDGEYLLASGTRASLPKDLGLGGEWLAVAEVSRTGQRATIRAGARLSGPPREPEETLAAELIDGRVRGRLIRHLGAIELSSTPTRVPADQAAEALTQTVTLADFRFGEKAQSLKERLTFLHNQVGEPWPDPEDGDLTLELEQVAKGKPISQVDMYPAMQRLLPWPEASRIDELAPERLTVPSGSRPRISYADGRPTVRVKLQECFGMASSPECAGVRVLFHLLSPAGRPLAVTDDLASFWEGPYQEVRKEMRGRYPKHPWPDDPWTAQATARTKRRG